MRRTALRVIPGLDEQIEHPVPWNERRSACQSCARISYCPGVAACLVCGAREARVSGANPEVRASCSYVCVSVSAFVQALA